MPTQERKIARIRFGFATEWELLKSFDETIDVRAAKGPEKKWVSSLKKYCRGIDSTLEDLPVDLSDYSKFQAKVLKQCRKIPFGKTMSYGELAARANSPGAARAVGTAMKKNRFPLVVPCHRVVAASGLGGYSAADGLNAKVRLLRLEGAM